MFGVGLELAETRPLICALQQAVHDPKETLVHLEKTQLEVTQNLLGLNSASVVSTLVSAVLLQKSERES